MRAWTPLIFGMLSLVGIAAGCSDGSGGGNGGDCVANATTACTGPAGCMGFQTCNPEGTGFTAPCDCGMGTGGIPGTGGVPGTGGTNGTGGTPGTGGGTSTGGTGGGMTACSTTFSDVSSEWCGQVKQCDSTSDEQTCINDLTNANAVRGPKFRCEYLDNLKSCFGTKDCVTKLNGTAFTTCNDEAVLLVAPSMVGADFCTAYGGALMNCGNPFDSAQCLQIVKTFSDETALAGQNCTMRPCAEIVNCVTSSFGGVQFGSPGCDDTCQFASDGACDDGGPGSSFSVCDFGTDCADCGPR